MYHAHQKKTFAGMEAPVSRLIQFWSIRMLLLKNSACKITSVVIFCFFCAKIKNLLTNSCKNLYEPPLCQIQQQPSQIDIAKEDADFIPGNQNKNTKNKNFIFFFISISIYSAELKHLWKSISFGRPANITNYRRIMNNSAKISKINSTTTTTKATKTTIVMRNPTPIITHLVHHSLNNKLYSSQQINEYLLRKKKLFLKNNHF